MMDQIASLVARGLISPDAAQGLVQQVADLKNRMPFESGGAAPTNSVYVPRGYGETIPSRMKPAEHLESLKSAGTDQDQFKNALDRLSNDKGIKNDDLRQIVSDYDAGVVRGKTRSDHLDQIQNAFTRKARFENKIK